MNINNIISWLNDTYTAICGYNTADQ